MNLRILLLLVGGAVLGGCREKPAAPPPPPPPAAGAEIALFRLGLSEDDVQQGVRAVPNFRRPDGGGYHVARTGETVSSLDAQPASLVAERPVAMRFRFEARRLVQAELTYRASDAAARGALYDRLLAGLADRYARSSNQVLDWGGRAAWLHAPDHMLLIYESRPDARTVTLRTSPPVFR